MDKIKTGNCTIDTETTRGWLIGNFLPGGSPLKTSSVEVKWGKHPAGTKRKGGPMKVNGDSVSILIYGIFKVILPDQNTFQILQKEGDYIFLPEGTNHDWEVLEDMLTITIRWPHHTDLD
jgi:hypothetical protein